MLTESILSLLITLVGDLEVNSWLPDNALNGSLSVTLANAPYSAPLSKICHVDFQFCNPTQRKTIKKLQHSENGWWMVGGDNRTKQGFANFAFPKRTKYFSKIYHYENAMIQGLQKLNTNRVLHLGNCYPRNMSYTKYL